MPTTSKNDIATIAAIAVMAMCMVTTDHEAIGHGSACLALGGRITLLTSSVFRCDPSSWRIAPAGPAMNLILGALALIVLRWVPARRIGLRLFLILMTAFSGFWEGGYAVQAMATRHGDLYFGGLGLFRAPELWWRVAGAAAGVALYIATWRVTGRALLTYPRATVVTAWLTATIAAVAAACLCTVGRSEDIHDAFTEIGLASVPLLVMALRVRTQETVVIARNGPVIVAACVVFAVFAATLGHGVVAP